MEFEIEEEGRGSVGRESFVKEESKVWRKWRPGEGWRKGRKRKEGR